MEIAALESRQKHLEKDASELKDTNVQLMDGLAEVKSNLRKEAIRVNNDIEKVVKTQDQKMEKLFQDNIKKFKEEFSKEILSNTRLMMENYVNERIAKVDDKMYHYCCGKFKKIV